MTTAKPLTLGQQARDRLTGVKGLLASRIELLTGNIRYALQPLNDAGDSVKDAYEIDEHTLEAITMRGKAVPLIEPPAGLPTFTLGARLRDRITGFVGLATARTTHVNGCVFYYLEGVHESKKPNEPTLVRTVNALHIELVDEGVSKLYARPEQSAQAPKPRPTGGPTTRLSAARAQRI